MMQWIGILQSHLQNVQRATAVFMPSYCSDTKVAMPLISLQTTHAAMCMSECPWRRHPVMPYVSFTTLRSQAAVDARLQVNFLLKQQAE